MFIINVKVLYTRLYCFKNPQVFHLLSFHRETEKEREINVNVIF